MFIVTYLISAFKRIWLMFVLPKCFFELLFRINAYHIDVIAPRDFK